ncbi:MAG: D-alanyl-D-alanine carboxypeptidase/D-alanyl-D-alanine-endopeptidase [Pseudomonadota bacterium]
MKPLLFALALIATPAAAQDLPLQQRVEAVLAQAAPGTRFGLVVADADGREIVAINPDQRFIPASNTKMFTTAAAFWTLDVAAPDAAGGASVRLEGRDVVLEGHGDARLSSADDCTVDCLATLADAVAARTRRVHDVIGDDSFYPDERWSPGMSWNNIPTRSGTGISALTLDDNEIRIRAVPGAAGAAPAIDGPAYYAFDNRVVTVAGGKTDIGYDRLPLERTVRLTGTIAAGAAPEPVRFGIDDPAHYAAWRFRQMLEARGVKVTGTVGVRHRPLVAADNPAVRGAAPPVRSPRPAPLAQLTPPPLGEDLTVINKVSQNLHAELMLRRVGYRQGTGSIADGLNVVHQMMRAAGAPRASYDFSDGSGMSSYNRVAPRGAVIFLRWIAAQPWGAAWRETLPVGGSPGTLSRRFAGTILEGRIFAKTGTLNATNALSGYMTAKSGKTLIISVFANDIPEDAGASKFMDAALVLIAEAN